MVSFKVCITIDRPVDMVVKALMNPDNFPYWQTDLERFEVMERKPGEVGSIGHLHYSRNGKKYVLEDRMVHCDPGKRYVSRVTGDAISATVETDLISSDGRTEMVLTWTGKGKVLLLKLLLPFLKGKMIRQSKKELETFKHLIETRGSDF
ncbi:MAG: SRPBCC family protein, partial [Candidatus Thermoplasmatota archaeon]|nr:SRPBCC family protein [Candidatus Thermoplasmatota archaeon]